MVPGGSVGKQTLSGAMLGGPHRRVSFEGKSYLGFVGPSMFLGWSCDRLGRVFEKAVARVCGKARVVGVEERGRDSRR